MSDMTDWADIGQQVLEAADEQPADEPAAEAPAPEAPAAEPSSVAAPPPLADPEDAYRVNDDGTIVVAGHTYANAQELAKAQWHAQQMISRGEHKRQPEPEPVQWEWDDDEEEDDEPEPVRRLATAGMPLGGEPDTVEELESWALEDPASAAMWTLANQERAGEELTRRIYAHWASVDPAGAHAYNMQLTQAHFQRQMDEMAARFEQQLEPYRAEVTAKTTEQVLAQIRQLPGIELYEPRMREYALAQGPEYAAMLDGLSAEDAYDELFSIYARLRVQDDMQRAMQQAAGAAPAPAAQQPAPTPPAPPFAERRGARAPAPNPADNMADFIADSVQAFMDPFARR